jgi:hypothetical protein
MGHTFISPHSVHHSLVSGANGSVMHIDLLLNPIKRTISSIAMEC